MFDGLRSLAQDKELCSDNLISFFKELDTRQGTLLQKTLLHFLRSLPQENNHAPTILFHFIRSLTQENELCSNDLVSFFKELDTRKGTLLHSLFHFLRSLTQENELCSDNLVSFFEELDTRKGTLLHILFHFLRSLTQENELCSDNLIIMNKKSSLPRVPLLMEGKHPGSQDPMPPAPDARRHCH